MAKTTISMKKFRASLTKISRLAKSGYNSITSVAKGIIATVTSIASKISVLSENAGWQPPEQSLPADSYQSYYNSISKAEESFLNRSSTNLTNYTDEIIADIYKIRDAAAHNGEQLTYILADAFEKAFGGSVADFFDYGVKSGESFGQGFRQSVETGMAEVKVSVYNTMRELYPLASATGNVSNITYSSPSYNFYGSGQTVSQQLSEARIADTVNALRGA